MTQLRAADGADAAAEVGQIDFTQEGDVHRFFGIVINNPNLRNSSRMRHIINSHGRRARQPDASFFRRSSAANILRLFRRIALDPDNIQDFWFENGHNSFVIRARYCPGSHACRVG